MLQFHSLIIFDFTNYIHVYFNNWTEDQEGEKRKSLLYMNPFIFYLHPVLKNNKNFKWLEGQFMNIYGRVMNQKSCRNKLVNNI